MDNFIIVGSARFLCVLRKKNFIAPVRKDEEKESETSRGHVVHAILVSGEPPEGLLTNLGVRPIDAMVVGRVAVIGAVPVSPLVVLPVEPVNKNVATHVEPKI